MAEAPNLPPQRRRQAKPVRLAPSGEAQILGRADPKTYDEHWIQRKIHEHPELLPIGEIEPAFSGAVAVCMELPLDAGPADNLLVNPDGNLVLVECKLWNNPEARRKVVAQIIDYAKSLAALDYDQLELAIRQSSGFAGKSLYEISRSQSAEAEFVDSVSRNLRLGRFLLLIAGDGIRESAESLSEYLQQHAGIHFTLALIQLSVHEDADGGVLIIPSTLARTVNIVRGIVEVVEGRPQFSAVPRPTQPETLTKEQFLEGLDRIRPGTSTRLRALLDRAEGVGLRHEMLKTLVLRIRLGSLGDATIATIDRSGEVSSDYLWTNRRVIDDDLLRNFQTEWTAAIPGAYATNAKQMPSIRLADRKLSVWDLLDQQEAWLPVIDRFRESALGSDDRRD
jgi:hypothetical protein